MSAHSVEIASPHSFALISATITAPSQSYQAARSLTYLGATLTGPGGTIHIGNQTTPTITIDQNTTISAGATGTTNAGRIIIYSAEHTKFYGTANATAEQGDGGFIELSSNGTITHATPLNISTASTYGTTGTLLIDPTHILIVDPSQLNSFSEFRAIFTPIEDDDSNNLPTTQASALFGSAVALSDTHALIGASGHDYSNRSNSGSAWLYNLIDGSWIALLGTSGAPFTQIDAGFGNAVALSDTHALIGTRNYLYSEIAGAGNAFLYDIINGIWTGLTGLRYR